MKLGISHLSSVTKFELLKTTSTLYNATNSGRLRAWVKVPGRILLLVASNCILGLAKAAGGLEQYKPTLKEGERLKAAATDGAGLPASYISPLSLSNQGVMELPSHLWIQTSG